VNREWVLFYLRLPTFDSRFSGCLSLKGEFLKMPEASHRWVKKPALESGKGNFSV